MNSPEQFFVSVIVCAFNEEKLLRSCLDGLAAQTYPRDRYEVLVIDDESTDKTFDIASEFIADLPDDAPRMRLVRIQHGGLSVARNSGIQLSEGGIIAFIDGDAVADVHWIEEITKPFHNDNADFVGGKIELLNTNSRVAQLIQLARYKQLFGPKVFLNQIIGCNMAYRKEIFEHVGGFYENFTSRGDETTLVERISSIFRYRPATNAIVYHEQPESIIAFIKNEWKSSTLLGLTRKVNNKISLKLIAAWVEQLLIVLLPFMIFLSLLVSECWVVILFSLIAFYRRLFIRPVSREIIKDLISCYGCYKAYAILATFIYVTSFTSIAGNFVGLWKHRNDTLIPPMTAELEITEKICNTLI